MLIMDITSYTQKPNLKNIQTFQPQQPNKT